MTPRRSSSVLKTAAAALAIFAIATLLRLAVAAPALLENAPERFVRPDTAGYLGPALTLAHEGYYPGTGRVPGFPAFAALFASSASEETAQFHTRALVVALCVASGVAAALVFLAGLCRSFGTGVMAGTLCSLNLTAVANAPMLLSDTLFGLVAAAQFLLFMHFRLKKRRRCFMLMTAVAAAGMLIRPINMLWIFPALALLLLDFSPGWTWRSKLVHAAAATLLFGAIATPWMFRNAYLGAGFTPDTNTGAVCHQNGAMLLAEVNGTDFETEKAQLLAEQNELFADTGRFPDEAARESWRLRRYRGLVLAHPLVWLRQSASWRIFIPDAPTFWELCGFTRPNRGTMGVMAKYGFFAGVRHYFGGSWKLPVLTGLLILPALALYLGALGRLVCDICDLRKRWYELLAFLAFAEYYLLLPGAITAPRYQIPALPILCVMAAAFLLPERSATNRTAEEKTE